MLQQHDIRVLTYCASNKCFYSLNPLFMYIAGPKLLPFLNFSWVLDKTQFLHVKTRTTGRKQTDIFKGLIFVKLKVNVSLGGLKIYSQILVAKLSSSQHQFCVCKKEWVRERRSGGVSVCLFAFFVSLWEKTSMPLRRPNVSYLFNYQLW